MFSTIEKKIFDAIYGSPATTYEHVTDGLFN